MMSVRPSAWRILWLPPGPALRPNIHTQPLSIARHFASSASRCKAAKPPKRSARSSTSPSTQPPTRSPVKPSQDDYAKAGARTSHFGRLAARVAKEGEVILSQAPSQRVYLMISYSLTATCFACAGIYSPLLLGNTPDPLATWIKVLYGGVCVTMSALGTKFLLPTGRLIQKTTAVMANNGTHVRFAVRRMVPFLKPRQLEALPQQITIERKLVISPESFERLQRGRLDGMARNNRQASLRCQSNV